MPLIIEQTFPLGRFHATRWRQNSFEDSFGEFPPSPYRLLRALTARWFQYARETGDNDTKRRDELLQKIAAELPSYSLPEFTWRGQPLKQYIPYKVEWTGKGAADAAYKKAQTTLVEDHYRLLPPDALLFWNWENLNLEKEQKDLLDQLLKRVLYFGRAESFSRLRRVEEISSELKTNCSLSEKSITNAVPVLVQTPNQKLNIAALLDFTDGKELRGRAVPPGTAWFYATLPKKPFAEPSTVRGRRFPTDLTFLQFAVGDVVPPPIKEWVKVTERFRGSVIKNLSRQLTEREEATYKILTHSQREEVSLITGKDADGNPLQGHKHAYFFLYPNKQGFPTRLIAWRKEPFKENEIEAMLVAAKKPIHWGYNLEDWSVKLVPLPFKSKIPDGLLTKAQTWISATPFVPPTQRHRFRKNGRERPIRTPEEELIKLFQKAEKSVPEVEMINKESTWVKLHETKERRLFRQKFHTSWVRPGCWLRLKFSEPISGPLLFGDSSHYGLGLFLAEE
jgi:CRISPR-associated protein Csb2